ncbi:MAG: UvrD-helicase domain-containing protein [Candidatus Omnitrophica bacterium]|nr:UvrD-helicase domain-containing protein [Candidatus Omnitrophota bacterium]
MSPGQNTNPNLNFHEVKIVEASAGSGKTYELSKRYIQLLINHNFDQGQIPLRNILAITFTLKATREMRERILEQLKKIALDAFINPVEKNNLINSLGLSPEKASQQAFKVLDCIILNYNYFQVKNVDKFINLILSGCASELNLSANFQIKENYSAYVAYALDECIDHVCEDEKAAKVFQDFIRQYIFLENRTSWLPKKDILNIISGMFRQSNIYGGKFKKFQMADNDLIGLKQRILAILNQIYDKKPEGINKRFADTTLANFIKKNKYGFNIADLDKKSFMSDTLPMNKGFFAPEELELIWQEFRQSIVELSEKEALSLFNCYIDIFDDVYKHFRNYAMRDDLVFMEELNKQAYFLFKEAHMSVPELYYRLASRFKHFLIDEFQDTSKLQWKNLFVMVEDALSSGGSLFYVGDRKQAIYRFRGGNVDLFDSIKKEFEHFNVNDKLVLKTNYRSQKQIILFNNRVFSFDNLRRFLEDQQDSEKEPLRQLLTEEVDQILSVFRDSEQFDVPHKPDGYVKVDYIEYQNSDERDELIKQRLIETMDTIQKRFDLKSIAVLCRSNREIELVTGWLSEKKINVESERTLNILNNSLISELIAFLRFLNSPIDTIEFSAFILGDIFLKATSLTQAEIADFIFQYNRKAKQQGINCGYMYRMFRKKYSLIWQENIAEFFKSVGFVSLYELLISIIDKFKIFENFPQYQGFFMRFLELIKEQEEDNLDIGLFLSYLETAPDSHLYVNFSDDNAVKVMTIHKAKGLGFPVVIVPFLEMNVKIKGANSPYVVYENELDLEESFGLLRLDTKYARFSKKIGEIYRQEYVKAFIDELNVIYVTFTRAQNELYIFIPYSSSKTAKSNNTAFFLIPEGLICQGSQLNMKAVAPQSDHSNMPISLPVYQNWISLLKEEFTEIAPLNNRENIKQGKVLHSLLSKIGNLSGKNLKEVIAKIKNEFEQENPDIENKARYIKKINQMISSEELKPFFYLCRDDQVYQEKEFVDKFGLTKRIDRLIISKDEVMIIDYKSSADNKEEYIAQISVYKNILNSIYHDKKIRAYLIYFDQAKAEMV